MDKSLHVAITMDGNGRWAQERHKPRTWGHIRGAKVVKQIVEEASSLGVGALTLYSFSTENFRRPKQEVSLLFKLLKKFLKSEEKNIIENDISFAVIGNYKFLDPATISLIDELTLKTKQANGLKLSFAFGYGGRTEITDSVNQFIKTNPNKQITEEDISKNLYRPESGDVDLLIRTGGNYRISNFLLWEISYAELFFTQVKWPDFTPEEFNRIILKFTKRDRRFGGLND